MAGAVKPRLTFKKIRLCLFLRSYGAYRISQRIKETYKINDELKTKELRKKYFGKRAIPEIARLSRTLNLQYTPLWESIVLNKTLTLNKTVRDKEKIKVYLAVENELITLSASKTNRSSSFFNPDYEDESAILSIATERVVGNKLINIEDDFVFEAQREILQKQYLWWYYQIAWKYKLPTIRIVPFVMRLITSS